MCGLAGAMSSWLTDPEIRNFQYLMTLAQFRGREGSGVVMVPERLRNDLSVIRSVDTADALVNSELFSSTIKQTGRVSLMIGHARFPTTGGLTIDDQHPIDAGTIVGVHNGTMSVVNGEKVTKTDHDSMMFFHAVAKHGIDEVIKKSEGEYCFVWWDKTNKTLNFLRNSKRPLYFAHYTKNTGTVYWGSEDRMLWYALTTRDTRDIEVRSLPPDTLFSFYHGSTRLKEMRMLKPEPRPVTVPRLPAPSNKPDNDVHIQYNNGKSVCTLTEFKRILSDGCCRCNNPADMHDFKTEKLKFYSPTLFMCEPCQKDDPTTEALLEQSGGWALH